MDELREQIDRIDEGIIKLLGDRRRVVQEVAEYKAKNGLPTFQPDRERLLMEKVREIAKKEGVEETLVLDIFSTILAQSKREQDNHRNIA